MESAINKEDVRKEYFLKEKFDELGGLEHFKEFIHFGLTSQDINNTSVPLSYAHFFQEGFRANLDDSIPPALL